MIALFSLLAVCFAATPIKNRLSQAGADTLIERCGLSPNGLSFAYRLRAENRVSRNDLKIIDVAGFIVPKQLVDDPRLTVVAGILLMVGLDLNRGEAELAYFRRYGRLPKHNGLTPVTRLGLDAPTLAVLRNLRIHVLADWDRVSLQEMETSSMSLSHRRVYQVDDAFASQGYPMYRTKAERHEERRRPPSPTLEAPLGLKLVDIGFGVSTKDSLIERLAVRFDKYSRDYTVDDLVRLPLDAKTANSSVTRILSAYLEPLKLRMGMTPAEIDAFRGRSTSTHFAGLTSSQILDAPIDWFEFDKEVLRLLDQSRCFHLTRTVRDLVRARRVSLRTRRTELIDRVDRALANLGLRLSMSEAEIELFERTGAIASVPTEISSVGLLNLSIRANRLLQSHGIQLLGHAQRFDRARLLGRYASMKVWEQVADDIMAQFAEIGFPFRDAIDAACITKLDAEIEL